MINNFSSWSEYNLFYEWNLNEMSLQSNLKAVRKILENWFRDSRRLLIIPRKFEWVLLSSEVFQKPNSKNTSKIIEFIDTKIYA